MTSKESASLGRLERRDPRSVWAHEAGDFTPWLFENSDLLADAIGIEIEIAQREHSVGSFSLDLFGRDRTHDCPLIVENQLEVTDHRHLGQLLTYAAGTDAMTVVWISPRFRDEHRQALEYLNAIAASSARFFGIELGVVTIGDSAPAPMLSLVVQPSDWRSQVKAQQVDGLSARQQQYLEFWTAFLDRLHADHAGATNVQTPKTANWMWLKTLRRGVQAEVSFSSKSDIGTSIYIDDGDAEVNDRIFREFLMRKAEIEGALGAQLDWEPLEEKQACRIRLARSGTVQESEKHGELLEWLIEAYLAVLRVFRPIVGGLDPALWERRKEATESVGEPEGGEG